MNSLNDIVHFLRGFSANSRNRHPAHARGPASGLATHVCPIGLTLAGAGVIVGLPTAFALTRLMRSLLFNVSPLGPWTYAAVPLILIAAAVLASYLPARRASTVDPMADLKAE